MRGWAAPYFPAIGSGLSLFSEAYIFAGNFTTSFVD